MPKVLDEVVSKKSSLKEWGVVGFCWGGKVTNLLSAQDSRFKAAAACHPAMVAADDAKNITIPFAMLPSKDEPKDDVEKWQQSIKVKNIVQWFPDQIHGWMAARSDLNDPSVKSE